MELLLGRAIEILEEEWDTRPPDGLNTVSVYMRLLAEEWEVPEPEDMNRLWDMLSGKYLTGRPTTNGHWYIQWVSPDVLAAKDEFGLL
jgi:hypothetical protein